MGQRTETFVTYINSKGEKTNNIYYNGWGIGRVQLMAIFGALFGQAQDEKFELDGFCKMHNDTKEIMCEGEDVNALDFTDINTIHDIVKHRCDNNNGGIVVIVNDEKPHIYSKKIKIGFFLGGEECYDWKKEEWTEEPYSRFVTFEEWAKKVGGRYVDKAFKKIVKGVFEHFEVEVLQGEMGKDKQ